jgi:iron(III) transport system substrate-binding protein
MMGGMRVLVLLVVHLALLAAPPARAEVVRLGPADAAAQVVLYSSLDARLAAPLIAAWLETRPGVAVIYHDLLTGEIAARIAQETAAGLDTADLALSSAMDLQVKLVNDGLAQPLDIAAATDWPSWAIWRDSAFALTFEPAVIVWHRPSFPDGPPDTRAALTAWLAQAPPGRIGTYDIGRAAVGYLFLARDQEHYADIWDLVAAMGRAGVVLAPTSQEIIDRVASGDLLIGYNVLGSYAAAQARQLPDLGVTVPRDFAVVVSRVALVPRAAARPDLGADLLAFLMSAQGQTVLARDLGLPALHPDHLGPDGAAALRATHGDILRPVPVSPGLLAYLDQMRRARVLARWAAALAVPDE